MIPVGTKVKVRAKCGGGSDATYAGRVGVVVEFDPSRGWSSPRALLAPEQYVCVHFVPRTKLEQKRGSPMVLLMEESLAVMGRERPSGLAGLIERRPMMRKFRKKPVEIEAVLWDGNMVTVEPLLAGSSCASVSQNLGDPALYIPTLEGEMRADVGDWIIRGVEGEIYPCKPSVFAATYDPV